MSAMLRSFEPATGALLWEAPWSDVADDVRRVAESWPGWAALPFVSRVEILRRAANFMRRDEELLTELIARETGRPLWDARAEVGTMALRIDALVTASSERTGQRRLEGALGARQALRHRPHGVMAVISPHCFPAQIPNDQIAAALVAGNGVLFKPSEKTPATGVALARIYHEAGVPQDLLRCVIGGPEAGTALAADPAVNGILFTGATQTGLAIARACAGAPQKLVSLAMSGNNPIIAWDAADLSSSAALIVQSAFTQAGQHCLAARRLIVAEPIAEMLIAEVKQLVDRLVIDQPHAEATPYMGPLIDMEAADGLTDSFLYLMSHGGRPISHMRRPFERLPFVTPGLIDVTSMGKRPDIELFGPILQVIRVGSFEEAVIEANDTRYGLAMALIGGGPEHYDYVWANSRTGIVNWNRPTTATATAAPLGGIGLSGNHRPSGTYMVDHCAYPVMSAAIDHPRAAIGIGVRQREVAG